MVFAARRHVAAQPPIYRPDWDSIDRRPTPPWYRDAKFAIFIQSIESRRAGSQIAIRIRDIFAAQLPQSEAYVFQIEGVTDRRKTCASLF